MADDLAQAAAALHTFTSDFPARALHRLTELVAGRVRGCAGATASLWELDDVAEMAASHPDLAALAERQFAIGDGPIIAALRTGQPCVTADTLHEERWPDFAVSALASGVRSAVTVVHGLRSMSLTLSLYGVRPVLDLDQLPQVSLLAAFGSALVAGAAEYGKVRRTAAQLEEAVQSRAVVDQAKGVLMQALGCDPDEAFDRLRRTSQSQHIKLTEVAAEVVRSRTRPE